MSRPRSLLRIPKVPNTAPNGKASIVDRVATYGGKFRQGKRFSDNPSGKDPKLAGAMSAKYDFDSKGPKATLAAAISASPIQYRSTFKSKTDRFKDTRKLNDLVYNINTGAKKQMTDAVLATGRNYSAMRSSVDRFRPATAPAAAHLGPGYVVADKPPSHRPPNTFIAQSSRFAPDRGESQAAPVYNINSGSKMQMTDAVLATGRNYSSMRSKADRFKVANVDPQLKSAMERLHYHVDAGSKMTMTTAVARSATSYGHVFKANYPRFPKNAGKDRQMAESLAGLQYDIDRGNKTSLKKQVDESPVVYSVLKSSSPRFRTDRTDAALMADLGPGAYDTKHAESYLEPRVRSITTPSTKRFVSTHDPSQNLGSTYRASWDTKKWQERGFAKVMTDRPPLGAPAAVDQMYDIDHGPKATLASAVKTSGRNYKASMHSKTARGMKLGDWDPDMGPGRYKPKVTKTGNPADTTVKDPTRMHASVRSSADRFAAKSKDKHLTKAMQTLDYKPERFGTIARSVETTERLYSGFAKGTTRKDLNEL